MRRAGACRKLELASCIIASNSPTGPVQGGPTPHGRDQLGKSSPFTQRSRCSSAWSLHCLGELRRGTTKRRSASQVARVCTMCHILCRRRCVPRRRHPMSLRKETSRAHWMRNANSKLLAHDDVHLLATCPTSWAT
eukprot:UN4250